MGLRLPNLETIELGHNYLNGIVPDSISNASRITKIYFGANQFSGTLPKSLGSLELLEDLVLPGNNFTIESSSMELTFVTSLINCRQLRVLSVFGNPFNDILPVSIGNLSTSLYTMDASYCKFKGNIPNEISNLTNLAFLDLDHNDIDGLISTTIKELWKLQILHL
ncbi:unnamed protein product [Ilex paraguariensis]|uniref:Non-specific serine/threonine protein kinase n=1 Tax=Ilex paraguariensis TaxID=185542 RepID=A0ABC8V1C0_9AQUA